MNKKMFSTIILTLLGVICSAQKISSKSQVILENQKNDDIPQINQLWNKYLLSSPDSLYNNPYWNNKEKEKHKSYDLLRSEGYLGLYNMAKYSDMKNLVLSITPIKNNLYDIHSMYFWEGEEYPYVICTTHVLSYKDEEGKFVLSNWLNYYSRNWRTYTKGKITYHYQSCKKNREKINKSLAFLSFIEKEYDVRIEHMDVFISSGWRESQRLKGFGYDIGETAKSDMTDLGGTTDIENCIIYSNSEKGEYYQHEMMRLVRSRYINANSLLTDGLSEYYSDDCVMRGISFKKHFQSLNDFLEEHLDINLGKFEFIDSGNLTESNYLIGMILVKMIDERCGHNKLIEALETVHTNNELINFINNELYICPEEINTVLRKKIAYYSKNNFLPKKWQ